MSLSQALNQFAQNLGRYPANAAGTRSASCPTPTEWPAICRLARSPGRQTYAHELPTLT